MSVGIVPGALADDVFSGLEGFAARAAVGAFELEFTSEFASVAMSGTTLDGSAEEFPLVLECGEVGCWFEGGGESISDRVVAYEGGFLPLLYPEFGGGSFSASEGVGAGDVDWGVVGLLSGLLG